jgi:hypothetical protein
MKQVDLPLIAISASLSTAITQLRKSKRSALLSKSKGEYHLFTVGDIAAGRSKGIKTLSNLKSTAKVKPEEAVARVRIQIKKAQPGEGRVKAAKAARVAGRAAAKYVLGAVSGKYVSVGIRSAELALNFVSSPKDLYCDGPNHHSVPPPDGIREGDPCPHLDGHTIVSAR